MRSSQEHDKPVGKITCGLAKNYQGNALILNCGRQITEQS